MSGAFYCPHCSAQHFITESLRNRIVVADAGTSISCPECKKAIRIDEININRDAGYSVTNEPMSLPLAVVAGVFGGVFFSAILHAVLWYIFSVDVAAWGAIPLFGFRLPWIYFALVGVFLVITVLASIADKAEARKN